MSLPSNHDRPRALRAPDRVTPLERRPNAMHAPRSPTIPRSLTPAAATEATPSRPGGQTRRRSVEIVSTPAPSLSVIDTQATALKGCHLDPPATAALRFLAPGERPPSTSAGVTPDPQQARLVGHAIGSRDPLPSGNHPQWPQARRFPVLKGYRPLPPRPVAAWSITQAPCHASPSAERHRAIPGRPGRWYAVWGREKRCHWHTAPKPR